MADPPRRPLRPQSANTFFKMPGYTGHLSGMYDTIGVTPAHAQYKALVRGFSEMDPVGKAPATHLARDPCNDPAKTFKRLTRAEELWPSAARSRPQSAPVKKRSNASNLVMGDGRYFQPKSHYSDVHADGMSASGAKGMMDEGFFSRKKVVHLGKRIPTRLSDLSHGQRLAKYDSVRRSITDGALERFECNMRLRLTSKAANDNVNGKRMMRMFNQFDPDQSGFVDFEEFHKGLLSYGIQLDTEQCLRLFAKYDPDCDGFMSYTEFMENMVEPEYYHLAFNAKSRLMQKRVSYHEEYLQQRAQNRVLTLRKAILSAVPNDDKSILDVFNSCDPDGSGTVTPEEFMQVLERLGFQLLPAEVELLFKHLDLDNDGHVDYPEFVHMLFP